SEPVNSVFTKLAFEKSVLANVVVVKFTAGSVSPMNFAFVRFDPEKLILPLNDAPVKSAPARLEVVPRLILLNVAPAKPAFWKLAPRVLMLRPVPPWKFAPEKLVPMALTFRIMVARIKLPDRLALCR